MSAAVFTLTKNGVDIGKRILDLYEDATLYTLQKFSDESTVVYEDGFEATVSKCFEKCDTLVFICATGIVVRSIAPYLKSKKTDPAVIVLDDNGKNVISLLSGHIGGANEETLRIAALLEANPVITTASDVNSKPSVDMIAKYNDLKLIDFEGAKYITAQMVANDDVALINGAGFKSVKAIGNLEVLNGFEMLDTDKHRGVIYISNDENIDKHDNLDIPSVQIYPVNLVIGIGCKRGTEKDHIIEMIITALKGLNKSIHSVKHVATVDVKADEVGLLDACEELGLDLKIVSRESIMEIEDKYEGSDFVKESVGVRAVSEPCCELTAKDGQFILHKLKYSGATISVWEEYINE